MRRLPQKLMLWGGAAAMASAGFAFLNTNTVSRSSAGEGGNTVSGYMVSTLGYAPGFSSSEITGQLTHITFKLTSYANTAAANGAPATVAVYETNSAGTPDSTLVYYGTRPSGQWPSPNSSVNVAPTYGMRPTCTLTTWGTLTTGHGVGMVSCTLNHGPGFQGITIVTFADIHVEANQ